MIHDYGIIGGGIIGMATAWHLLQARPHASLLVLEKEDDVGRHQTGHNSGVIHAGIYYAPGSLKARLCRQGLAATLDFCREQGVAHEQCGKLIVATNTPEAQRLDALFERATRNGLRLERLSAAELREREPNVTGVAALFSPETAIVDYAEVCRRLAALVRARGAELVTGARVIGLRERSDQVEITTPAGDWRARRLIVCGGLQADRLARLAGLCIDFHIVPFRGEYFRLPVARNHLIRHLIYPAPDPNLPFLGVHLTRLIAGGVTVGPNAVIGLAREGYPKFSIHLGDLADFATFSGFWRLVWAHRRHALHEIKGSLWRRAYLAECHKYCPSLQLSDLLPYRAGIRAQVVTRQGEAVHDFLFGKTARMLHVFNAPSPAATAALPIGRLIVEKLLQQAHGISSHPSSASS